MAILMVFVAITTTIFFADTVNAESTKSQVLGFQGRLLDSDGANVPDGHYNVEFKIYQGGKGSKSHNPSGQLVWKESYRNTGDSQGVNVTKGRFSVNLGSQNPLTDVNWSSGTLWLSLNIAGSSANCSSFGATGCQSDGEMLPMTRITSTPHALDSSRLDGKSSSDYVQLGQGVQTDDSDSSSIHINKTGSGDLLQLQKDSLDVMTVSGEGDITLGSNKSSQTISIAKASGGTKGGNLAISAGDGSSGGNLTLKGGQGANGAEGLVVIDTPTFSATTDDESCFAGGVLVASSCTFSSSSLNNSAVLMAGFSAPDQTATLPDPILKTAGRLMYVTAAGDSQPFSLQINQARASQRLVQMEGNDTVSLLWNGRDWTVAGQAIKSATPSTDTESDTTDNQTNVQTDNQADQTVDASGSEPDTAPIGSLYYDTKLGELRCYESEGWGPCANAPDEFVSLSPEYSNAVVRQTGIGEMTTDTCSDSLHINDGTVGQDAVCGEDETYNYYNWSTEEFTPQARSIFVTYKLSDDFDKFVAKSTSLMAMTDSDEAGVSYQIYRKHDGGKLTACGEPVETTIGSNNAWSKLSPEETDDPSECDFQAGDSIVFEISMTASDNANAYISDLDFVIHNK
ncbi:MAG: hypothetical protein L0H36_00780 [bacterium]|nr:hypothetical protein [bacterium]MDN5835151.1 hypothetical protein [bacterium]